MVTLRINGGIPGLSAGDAMVEAAGQLFHLFRDGLDYAFILRAR